MRNAATVALKAGVAVLQGNSAGHVPHCMTPAMAAGVTDRVWEIGDIVKLIEEAEMDEFSGSAPQTVPA